MLNMLAIGFAGRARSAIYKVDVHQSFSANGVPTSSRLEDTNHQDEKSDCLNIPFDLPIKPSVTTFHTPENLTQLTSQSQPLSKAPIHAAAWR